MRSEFESDAALYGPPFRQSCAKRSTSGRFCSRLHVLRPPAARGIGGLTTGAALEAEQRTGTPAASTAIAR